jgi:hypothetical protein
MQQNIAADVVPSHLRHLEARRSFNSVKHRASTADCDAHRLWSGALLLVALTVAQPTCAEQTRFVAHAVVTPRTTLESAGPATIDVSAGDIQRGYVEPVVRYRVRSNDPRGFLLQVRPRAAQADAVALAGSAQLMALGVDGVEVYHPWVRGVHEVAVRVRVVLQGVTRPGRVALPVHVSVAAL